MKAAIIGYGGRGRLYADLWKKKGIEIAAICDTDRKKLDLAKEELSLDESRCFESEEAFFSRGKLCELLAVCTQDELHEKHAIEGLEAGYDLLLEKPIACSLEECECILQAARKAKRQIFVCHVLRYAPFFAEIKRQLDSGKFGKVVTATLTENVGYWHQAHSFVRGSWRNDASSNPMIVAKCCHDVDILSWFFGEKCAAVSSFGSLSVFNEAHAPEGSAERCVDCKYVETCPYSCFKFYVEDRAKHGMLAWPCDIVVNQPTVEKLRDALSGDSPYGRCVYRCDNNVVDHQVVNMAFEHGGTAHLTMTAFSAECFREIHLHCEKGEIFGDNRSEKITCNVFGGESYECDTSVSGDTAYGHGGGDKVMLDRIADYYDGRVSGVETSIENSMQSHIIGFQAENSRKNGGKTIQLL